MYLYHIRFTSADESFEKIGITSKKSVFERFGKGQYLEYTMNVLNIEELPDKECKAKEKKLHKKFKEYQYFPLNEDFSGKTECFYCDLVYLDD